MINIPWRNAAAADWSGAVVANRTLEWQPDAPDRGLVADWSLCDRRNPVSIERGRRVLGAAPHGAQRPRGTVSVSLALLALTWSSTGGAAPAHCVRVDVAALAAWSPSPAAGRGRE